MTVEPSEPELMSRLSGGDDLALNVLMDRWGERIAAFLYKMTGSHETAVDLAQETFVKLYQGRGRYRPTGSFSTYLFAIAANLARNHARWKSRHPTLSIDATSDEGGPSVPEATDPNQTPAEAAQAAERIRAVHAAFLCLPEDLREAMTLFVHEDMGYAEIAAVAGCSAKAVETRIYRARRILREQLKEITP